MEKKIKFNFLIIILLIPTVLMSAIIPIFIEILPPKINLIMLSMISIGFLSIMGLLILSMLVSKNWMIKFTVIPLIYTIGIIGYFVYESNFYKMIMGVLQIGQPYVYDAVSSNATTHIFTLFSTVGVFLSCLPLIVCGIYKTIRVTKVWNTSGWDSVHGVITGVEDTYTKINKLKVYRVSINVSDSDGERMLTREVRIPIHVLPVFVIGENVNLLVNPKKSKEFVVVTQYGEF